VPEIAADAAMDIPGQEADKRPLLLQSLTPRLRFTASDEAAATMVVSFRKDFVAAGAGVNDGGTEGQATLLILLSCASRISKTLSRGTGGLKR
jgi:hypothetical protein